MAAGVSFLGLPPLPAVPLPYKDNSAPAPMIAESGALAPAPSKDDFVTGKGLVSSVANTYIQVSVLPWPASCTSQLLCCSSEAARSLVSECSRLQGSGLQAGSCPAKVLSLILTQLQWMLWPAVVCLGGQWNIPESAG